MRIAVKFGVRYKLNAKELINLGPGLPGDFWFWVSYHAAVETSQSSFLHLTTVHLEEVGGSLELLLCQAFLVLL